MIASRSRKVASTEAIAVAVCYCTECQRQSGSAFGMSLLVREKDLHLVRGDLKTFTRTADSGREVAAAFCPRCGVRLYSKAALHGGVLSVKPGTLDDPSFLRPTIQVYTVRRQPWVGLSDDIRSIEWQP